MILLSPQVRQYKANLHSHSTISDGKLTPQQLKDAYKAHGYDILCITDHEVPCAHQDLADPDFMMLTGYECYIRPGKFDLFGPEVHLNLFARDPMNETMINYHDAYGYYLKKTDRLASVRRAGSERPREYNPEYVNEYIATAKKEGYIVAYNHYGWSLEPEDFALRYEGCFSMEIFNFNSYLRNNFEYNAALYDKMLRSGRRIACHATDDNHNFEPLDHPACDSFGGFAMILPEEFTYSAVIDAMEKGKMYASRGPLFEEIAVENGRLYVRCSPVHSIHVYCGSKEPERVFAPAGQYLTEGEFKISSRGQYLRVTVTDWTGRTADSRGYFREEWEG